jgi:precorrin-6B methylase 2
VFELGGGSGWNAALMGRLVGPEGRVCSVEIIPELVETAQAAIDSLGIANVSVVQGDGSEGHAALAPYHRGVFTAAAWDLPRCFFEQIEEGGRLLLVARLREGADMLAALRKTGPDTFESEQHFRVSFVPVVGERARRQPPPRELSELPDWEELKSAGDAALSWQDLGVPRSEARRAEAFVAYAKDCQQRFRARDAEYADVAEEFRGWRGAGGRALTLFNEDGVRILGDPSAEAEIRAICREWTGARFPSIEDLALSIHARGSAPSPGPGQWLVERGDSVFRWSLRRGK